MTYSLIIPQPRKSISRKFSAASEAAKCKRNVSTRKFKNPIKSLCSRTYILNGRMIMYLFNGLKTPFFFDTFNPSWGIFCLGPICEDGYRIVFRCMKYKIFNSRRGIQSTLDPRENLLLEEELENLATFPTADSGPETLECCPFDRCCSLSSALSNSPCSVCSSSSEENSPFSEEIPELFCHEWFCK